MTRVKDKPLVSPKAYKVKTAWMAVYIAGTKKVSDMTWVIFSRLARLLKAGSVSKSG